MIVFALFAILFIGACRVNLSASLSYSNAYCKAHEVPCKEWNGLRPKRSCAHKHRLCDGADDCGNGYDEESPVSKQWCINTCVDKPWLNCSSDSTCCNSNDKCIPRAHVCDGNYDCEAKEDEVNCCIMTFKYPLTRISIMQHLGSTLRLSCVAEGTDRPTINWRCNNKKLRNDIRMKESNRIIRKNLNNTYVVEGTLVIKDFKKNDECFYTCELFNRCRQYLSEGFDVKGAKSQNLVQYFSIAHLPVKPRDHAQEIKNASHIELTYNHKYVICCFSQPVNSTINLRINTNVFRQGITNHLSDTETVSSCIVTKLSDSETSLSPSEYNGTVICKVTSADRTEKISGLFFYNILGGPC